MAAECTRQAEAVKPFPYRFCVDYLSPYWYESYAIAEVSEREAKGNTGGRWITGFTHIS